MRREKVFLNSLIKYKNFKNIWTRDYNSVHYQNKDNQIFWHLSLWKLGSVSLAIQNELDSTPLSEYHRSNAIPVLTGLAFTCGRSCVLYFGRIILEPWTVIKVISSLWRAHEESPKKGCTKASFPDDPARQE